MENYAEKILLARNGNEAAVIEIIAAWEPSINHYVRMLNYDEDCRSELICKLLALIKKEIPVENMISQSDGAYINYINRALHNYYIVLSKNMEKRRDDEMLCDEESFLDLLEYHPAFVEEMHDNLLIDSIRPYLTEKELQCLILTVLRGLTCEQAAGQMGITRQAVNQNKQRALSKLYPVFYRVYML